MEYKYKWQKWKKKNWILVKFLLALLYANQHSIGLYQQFLFPLPNIPNLYFLVFFSLKFSRINTSFCHLKMKFTKCLGIWFQKIMKKGENSPWSLSNHFSFGKHTHLPHSLYLKKKKKKPWHFLAKKGKILIFQQSKNLSMTTTHFWYDGYFISTKLLWGER